MFKIRIIGVTVSIILISTLIILFQHGSKKDIILNNSSNNWNNGWIIGEYMDLFRPIDTVNNGFESFAALSALGGEIILDTPKEVLIISSKDGWYITFFNCVGWNGGFCGTMFNGEQIGEGMAACSDDLEIDTYFKIEGDVTGRVYKCGDRGYGGWSWVDIWFYSYAEGIEWISNLH